MSGSRRSPVYRTSKPGALIHHAQARDYWAVHRWFFQGHYVTGIQSWTASSAQLHLRALDTFVAETRFSRLYDLMNIRFLPQGMDPPPPAEGKYEPWDLQPGSRWQIDLAGLAPLEGAVELGVTGGAVDVDVTRGGAAGRARVEEALPGRFTYRRTRLRAGEARRRCLG